MKIHSVILGSWYPRTTIHLTEVFDLFTKGESNLPLNKTRLDHLRQELSLVSVSRQSHALEYINASTKQGINIHYYEDGLITLTQSASNHSTAASFLQDYYQNHLTPAIGYIFSLGAPTPKILAHIKTTPPVAVLVSSSAPDKMTDEISQISPVYTSTHSKGISVYKTPNYIFVVAKKIDDTLISLVENQIFFREFKDQMERYLNIHREIWEEIDLIKDVQSIKGKNIGVLRQKIDGYQKTIRLIESRINQMSSYVDARSSITRSIGIEDSLSELFQYKFQTLSSTHGYIKEIWRMTNDYLNSAYQVLSTLESESTKESITSLRLITTYGVIAGIISYLSRDSWPEVTTIGIIYFILLIVATWLINKIITIISTNSSYKLKFNKDNL